MIEYNYPGPTALHEVSKWHRNIASLKPGIWIRSLTPKLVRIPWPSIGLLLFISHITKKTHLWYFQLPFRVNYSYRQMKKLGFRNLSKLLRAIKPVEVKVWLSDLLGSKPTLFLLCFTTKTEYKKQNAKLNLCLKQHFAVSIRQYYSLISLKD